jgi:hypothetical protein
MKQQQRAFVVLGGLLVLGFVGFGWAWHGAKHVMYVPLQAPWVISGGIAGVALVGLAAASWHIHASRIDDASHREEWDAFTDQMIETFEAIRERQLISGSK